MEIPLVNLQGTVYRAKTAELLKDVKTPVKVKIVGAGATGSHIAKSLAKTPQLFDITIIDGDVFQPHNIGNQDCSIAEDMEVNKAEAVAASILRHQGTKINFIPEFITPENMVEILSPDDKTILLLCADNIDITKQILELCLLMPCFLIINTGIPLNVKHIALAQGVVRTFTGAENILEYLAIVADTNQADINEALANETRTCRTQSFYPLVSIVSDVASLLTATVAFYFNSENEVELEIHKSYIIGGAFPSIRTEQNY